ncbi:TRAP transporter substrate-binding protein [Geomicrobium sp. JCM 19038]|uniref:TRAP transporter substrate-binding protein n=1 Tax=Geomicrobium sp. JCM 19038 TaxID=1460635 RepID=UPI00045F3E32|nr:TRAP transporter substrate-binding protein [Geomicrobium sp. JCM 19038]GAK09033.1 TRAP transporter solute receptor, unknown substrate 3 [Geomicrobium sp. JCM 19038]
MTNGEVKITSYPSNQLAQPDSHYDAAARGVVDMGYSVHSYRPGQFPLTSVLELPFISESATEGAEIMWDLMDEFPELRAEYDDVELLWLATSEPAQLYTTEKQVKKIEDLRGMRIRSPSMEVNSWLEEVGATPVSMPMSDVYEALDRGVVDGMVGPTHTLLDYSLQNVIDYVTIGNFYMTTFYGAMNQESWRSLSDEHQTAIDPIKGRNMAMQIGAMHDAQSEEAIKTAKAAGAIFYELNEDEIEEWRERMQPAIDDWIKDKEERGLPGQEIYDKAVEQNLN